MSNTWSVLWRIIVLQAIATIPVVIAIQSSGVVTDHASIIKWKPTMVYAFMAVVLLLARIKIQDGALSKIWGNRISSSGAFWRHAQIALVAMYVCLAIANVIAAYNLPLHQWVTYKMWVPLACFVLVSAWLARQLNSVSNAIPAEDGAAS